MGLNDVAAAGDPLVIEAAVWNDMKAAARRAKERTSSIDESPDSAYPASIGVARNDTGADRERFDVVGLGVPLILPADNLAEWQGRPAFVGLLPVAGTHEGAWGVLLEPLASGDLGAIGLAGVYPVGLVPDNPAHTWANLKTAGMIFAEIDGGEVTLKAGTTGSARILWAADANEDGEDWRWATVRIANSGGGGFNGSLEVCTPTGTKTLTIVNGVITAVV
jgi:hypothetical protein